MSAELEALTLRISACRICRDHPRGPALPHEPRPVVVASSTARVLICGQAPGLRVHETGMPFNDRSGDRLREWMGVNRDAFYDPALFAIAPMGFCFPGYDAKGSDLPPRGECAPAWRAALMSLMPQVDLVLAIGQYAQAWHMGTRRGRTLTETVRDWRVSFEAGNVPIILPLPHPSWRNTGWIRKNPWFERELLPVLRAQIQLRIHE